MDRFLVKYLKNFENEAFIPADELNFVIGKAQDGDKMALKRIISSFQLFIVHVAKRCGVLNCCKDSELQADIISAGNMGLISAVYNYNCSKGALFNSYADRCITGAIYDFLNGNHQIHYPKDVIQDINKLSKLSKGKTITKENSAYFAEKSGISEKRILKIAGTKYSFTPIEGQNSKSGEDYNICDSYGICYSEGAEDFSMKNDSMFQVRKVMETLTEREQFVIRKYFGFDGEEYTLSEIGEMLGLTKGRVGQLCKDVLRKLKNETEYPYLSDLLAS